ncbi:NADH-quinone oxidoreductase subunit L [Brumicola nitratireducens]|uniref:Probable inorganic carbon transporter subunit DabB n=1 Tax=Glaciecola nitratireducens (strain JCM 12485 / KCTC 12276 / FR1064) TaxID=1085623 RepID=G4QL47_GLANF|nr:NADH-quinone oxidoreductase subunit L [Glaciecola nitratireducens]AEP29518.1 NADH dehydrogenase subunit L [Glaciecola nitratireducens FR1064]
MWLTSTLLVSIPLSLSAAGWWVGRQQSNNNGQSLFRLSLVLLAVFTSVLLSKLLLTSSSDEHDLISHANLNLLMLGLVLFMAVILIAFSRNYMAGQAQKNKYWCWLLNTLAAVSLVVISNHLLLFWLGWLSISLALHKLLTYYPDRPRAILAAHKKFLLARTAELSLLLAIALLYQQHQTFYISELITYFNLVAQEPSLSLAISEQIAAVLIAITALIKCAQLPVHGWLIQVVEAPTPVSALLHAGVINLGGFLLILFAPLFIQVPFAQWLVLIVAGLTTCICALVMSTRISLKVRLAWSTSAQMGLMLVECALGLFELALLHLLAHSAYKAYAFLNSGSAVLQHLQERLAPANAPSLSNSLVSFVVASLLVGVPLYLIDYQGVVSVWVLLILALSVLIAHRHSRNSRAALLPFVLLSAALLIAYSLMKTVFIMLLPIDSNLSLGAFSPADLWVIGLVISLFTISWLLRFKADHPSVQRLSISLFAGLYLDEWLTRLTLKIWPVKLPVRVNAKKLDMPAAHSVKEI